MGIVFGKIGVEQAKFTSLVQDGCFEVRRYDPSVGVSTEYVNPGTDTTTGEGSDAAFRRLAAYIGVFRDPENKAAEKVAMTAPVMTEPEKVAMTAPVITEKVAMTAPVITEKVAMTAPVMIENAEGKAREPCVMTFILPAKYTLESAPIPNDEKVYTHAIPERFFASSQFSWTATDAIAEEKAWELLKWLNDKQKKNYSFPDPKEGEEFWTLCRYNPPFSLPWMKTNEVLIPITPLPAQAYFCGHPAVSFRKPG